MTIILIVLAVLAIGFGIFSFITNTKEKKELQDELKRTQNQKTACEEVIKNYGDAQRENEELITKSYSGNNVDSADANVQLLHKLSEKGKNRNSK